MDDVSAVTTSTACLSPAADVDSADQAHTLDSSDAAEPYVVPLTLTQAKICSILKVDAVEALPTDALRELIMLETRQLPANLAAHMLEPSQNPRMCCFDTACAQSSWAAHTLCKRCALLNVVLQAPDRTSSIVKAMIASAHLTTDCFSFKQHSGETSRLPRELVDIIIAFAISELRRPSGDGKAVCKLLHLSASTRRLVSKAFQPIGIFECESKPMARQEHKLNLSKDLSTFMWEAVSTFLGDWSVQLQGAKALKPKNPGDIIATTTGLHTLQLTFNVRLITDAFKTHSGEIVPQEVKAHAVQVVTRDGVRDPIRVAHACDCFWKALQGLGLKPRSLNMYQRALCGKLQAPATVGAVLNVKMTLGSLGGDATQSYSRTWQYDTLKSRKVAPA